MQLLFDVELSETSPNLITGYYTDGADIYRFELSDRFLNFAETEERRAYVEGLTSRAVRRDRKPPKCKPGNKLCGEVCIPKGHRCTVGLSQTQSAQVPALRKLIEAGKKRKGLVIGGVATALAAVGVGAAIAGAINANKTQPPQPVSPQNSQTRMEPDPWESPDPVRSPNRVTTSQNPSRSPLSLPPAKQPLTMVEPDPWDEPIVNSQNPSRIPSQLVPQRPPLQKQPATPSTKPMSLEQQTEQLLQRSKGWASLSSKVAKSKANPEKLAEYSRAIDEIEQASRQKMNPLLPSYFDTAAKKITELKRTLYVAERDRVSLQSSMSKGRTVQQVAEEAQTVLPEIDGHLVRLNNAVREIEAQPSKFGSTKVLSNLKQQVRQLQTVRSQIFRVQSTAESLSDSQTKIYELIQKLDRLPQRPSQLSVEEQAQHREIQRLRTMHGNLPEKIQDYQQLNQRQSKRIAAQQEQLQQLADTAEQERQFTIDSISRTLESRQARIAEDMELMRLISGPEGIKWVMSKPEMSSSRNAELIARAQRAAGVNSISSFEEAAKFRRYVRNTLGERIEETLKDVEKRVNHPQGVAKKYRDRATKQIQQLQSLQKETVIEGRDQLQGVIRDLDKAAQRIGVELAGNPESRAVAQPYREAYEAMSQELKSQHAQKARAVGETLVDANALKTRLSKQMDETPIYEVDGIAKTANQIKQDMEAVRQDLLRVWQVQPVKIQATPTEETQRRLTEQSIARQEREQARTQIADLQRQMGELSQQIRKRQEARERGQKKGINTGKLEAERAGLQKQIDDLISQYFTAIEPKRQDSVDRLLRQWRKPGLSFRSANGEANTLLPPVVSHA